MPWPKGKPRKGHINKDGKPHSTERKKQDRAQQADPAFAKLLSDADTAKSFTRTEAPVLHGVVGNGAISAPCPVCMYAYADGGYCPDCGWSKPIRIDEYGTNSGRRF